MNGSAGAGGSRRRSRRRPSLEIDVAGTPRHLPSDSGSSSDASSAAADGGGSSCSDGDAAGTPGAAAAQRGGGSRQQQRRHDKDVASSHNHHHHQQQKQHISTQEWGSMALLVLLYAMQGIPLGLTLGAMPFLLQAKLSMTQMGLFSISGYPYSFKLLWSPIVDSLYSTRLGRRKSWIVPVQLASAALLLLSADWIQARYEAGDVAPLTALFFFFVLLAATQDIAVDGWALTLLPPHHVEYASTCQTLGMNAGYFLSFTVFLALSNAAFCNQYIRSSAIGGLLGLAPSHDAIISLRGYIVFWGCAFTLITLAIALFKSEHEHFSEAPDKADWRRRRQRRQQQQQQLVVGARRSPRLGARGAASVCSPGPSPGTAASRLEAGTAGVRRGKAAAAAAGGDAYCAAAEDSSAALLLPGSKEPDGGVSAAAGLSGWAGRREEIVTAYVQLWGVVCLPAIWGLSLLLLTYRLGVLPAESAAALKLLDKGVAKEALAALVLVQFPVELASAVIAGRWASMHSPYQPFMAGYFVRLVCAGALTSLAAAFPPGASSFIEHRAWFGALATIGLVTSFSSTLMFTALGSFFNRVSDPGMGGAYLTLLNTIANMGVILPKTPLFAAIDWLTVSTCRTAAAAAAAAAPHGSSIDGLMQHVAPPAPAAGVGVAVPGLACPKKMRLLAESNPCTDAGHMCVMEADGFYVVSCCMLVAGVAFGLVFRRLLPALIALPPQRWRAPPRRSSGGGGGTAAS